MEKNPICPFRWSLKRKSGLNSSFRQSNEQYCDRQPLPNGADDLFLLNRNDNQILVNQGVPQNEHDAGTNFMNINADQIQLVEEEAHCYVPTDQNNLSIQMEDESPAVKAKKMKFEEQSNPNIMDIDTLSERVPLNKDLDEIFKIKVDELKVLESRYSEWIDKNWIPSKDEAVQMLTDSIILKQRLQELSKCYGMTEEMRNILEIVKILIMNIKESISECDACSMELMDYETCLPQKWSLEKMSAESIEGRKSDHEVDWTLKSEAEKISSDERPSDLDEEDSTMNAAAVNQSQEDEQQCTDTPDNIPQELDPAIRAQKVRAIRALLLPQILYMLDNYDEWSKKHHDQIMCEFLDTKQKEFRQ
ncbi:uncharacterized protein [Bemisia tabaci]|uniref:uncharacterized protein n=1 Tax=Bemisia tabaci TaxID=7038 RepID=UPI003B27E29D